MTATNNCVVTATVDYGGMSLNRKNDGKHCSMYNKYSPKSFGRVSHYPYALTTVV